MERKSNNSRRRINQKKIFSMNSMMLRNKNFLMNSIKMKRKKKKCLKSLYSHPRMKIKIKIISMNVLKYTLVSALRVSDLVLAPGFFCLFLEPEQ